MKTNPHTHSVVKTFIFLFFFSRLDIRVHVFNCSGIIPICCSTWFIEAGSLNQTQTSPIRQILAARLFWGSPGSASWGCLTIYVESGDLTPCLCGMHFKLWALSNAQFCSRSNWNCVSQLIVDRALKSITQSEIIMFLEKYLINLGLFSIASTWISTSASSIWFLQHVLKNSHTLRALQSLLSGTS